MTGTRSRHELVRAALSEGRNPTEPEAYRIVADYGIPVPRFGVARDAEEAARIAGSVGYPVVAKIVSPDVLHKSDIGGVVVGLASGEEVARAYELIVSRARQNRPGVRVEAVLVAEQVGFGSSGPGERGAAAATATETTGSRAGAAVDAVEVIVGATRDPQFGHAVMFGLGGIFVEVFRDVAFRVTPVTRADAFEMIDETRGRVILRGTRGQSPRDIDALADIIVRVSRLADENPEVSAIDLNPVLALARGACVVDAKIVVGPGGVAGSRGRAGAGAGAIG